MSAISEHVLRLAEALIFTSEAPVPAALLIRQLDPATDINQLIAALTARHAGRGSSSSASLADGAFGPRPTWRRTYRRYLAWKGGSHASRWRS